MSDRDTVLFWLFIFLFAFLASKNFFLPWIRKTSRAVICRATTILGMDTAPETLAENKFRRVQFMLTALFLTLFGGMAVYRTLSIDAVGADGWRCAIVSPKYIKNDADEIALNIDTYKHDKNPFDDIYNKAIRRPCDVASEWAIVALRLHPAASIFGSLVPIIILSPLVYWMVGRAIRRTQQRVARTKAQYKKCDFCAEKIKAEAKVCRFCGRELSQSPLAHDKESGMLSDQGSR
jgi:hypothetical protein